MKPIFIMLGLLFCSLLLFGCTASGGISTNDDAKRQQCQNSLDSCNSQCDNHGYWLGGDLERCKGNCASVYSSCMS